MYYKHTEKVNLHLCIDLPAGKVFPGIEPAGGGLHHTTKAHPRDKHS